jgi:hypothetical protein
MIELAGGMVLLCLEGESQTGTAGPPFTIKPSADPSTKDYTGSRTKRYLHTEVIEQ